MSYGSEKSFTGKNQNKTNPKTHKKVLTIAALILIVSAIAWTVLYSKAKMTTDKVNPVDLPPIENSAP
ncbi:MAG: hypothetical protein V4596_11700 [Bdellovibrionota bacterium]